MQLFSQLEEVLRSSTEASEQLSVRLQQAGVDLERELRNVKPRAYGRIGEAIQLNVYDCNLQGLDHVLRNCVQQRFLKPYIFSRSNVSDPD